MDSDSGVRPKFGLLVTLVEQDDGTSLIVFDDARSESPARETRWAFDGFVTQRRFDSAALAEMTLPQSDYEAIAVTVVARLLALNEKT